MWSGLLAEARSSELLAVDLAGRMVRDLMFGAMNSPTTHAHAPEAVVATLAAFIGVDRLLPGHHVGVRSG